MRGKIVQGRILLIMPKFFNYPEVIQSELGNMGYEVDYFDDRPSTKGIIKAVIRVKKDLIKGIINTYFEKLYNFTKNKKYDYVFVISGQSLSFSKEMMIKLKKSHTESKFVLYQWDSEKNFTYIREMHDLFDKLYSFDPGDCNETIKLLPLFYSKEYELVGSKQVDEFEYDFCFVGTAHPKKYAFITKMRDQLKETYKNMFIYFFFPSKLVYIYRKFKNSEFKEASIKEFNFKSLNSDEMLDYVMKSRCILDSAQDGQLGLTIRVLETLGAKRKLITTNHDVIKYDFYCQENIYVYDGDFDFDSDFFKKPYKEVSTEIYQKYSLKSWLEEILK